MNVFAMTSNVEWQETGASAESVVPPITPVKLPGRPTADNYIGCYVDNEHARVLSLATTTSDGMTEGVSS